MNFRVEGIQEPCLSHSTPCAILVFWRRHDFSKVTRIQESSALPSPAPHLPLPHCLSSYVEKDPGSGEKSCTPPPPRRPRELAVDRVGWPHEHCGLGLPGWMGFPGCPCWLVLPHLSRSRVCRLTLAREAKETKLCPEAEAAGRALGGGSLRTGSQGPPSGEDNQLVPRSEARQTVLCAGARLAS